MARSFIKDFLTLSLGTITNIIISVITTPIITRIVNPDQYGQYSLMLTYGSICSAIVVLGLNQALIRFFYISEDLPYRKALIRFCFAVPLALTIIACLASVAFFVGTNNDDVRRGVLFGSVFSVYLISLTLNTFSSIVTRLQFKIKLLSFMTVVNKIVFVAFALFLILATSLEDSLSLILATAVAGVIVSVVQIVNDKNLWDPRNASASHVVDISALLRYALPVWLSSGIAILLQGIDKMGLGFFSTDYELGIYASAFSIVNIFSIIQSSFNTIWQPTSIERYEKNRNDTAFFIRGNDLITLAMFGLGIIIIIFKDIFILLLGAEYRSASSLVPYLIFVPIFYTISETTVSGINFTNKTKYHLLISVGALGVAFVSMVLTVPSLGSIGAALSMSLAYATFFALRSHYGQKCFFVRFHFKKIALTSIVVFAYATFCTFATCQVVESLVGLPILAFVLLIYRKTTAEMLLLAKGKFKGLLSKRREK